MRVTLSLLYGDVDKVTPLEIDGKETGIKIFQVSRSVYMYIYAHLCPRASLLRSYAQIRLQHPGFVIHGYYGPSSLLFAAAVIIMFFLYQCRSS